jgi:hypothetical protein
MTTKSTLSFSTQIYTKDGPAWYIENVTDLEHKNDWIWFAKDGIRYYVMSSIVICIHRKLEDDCK